MINIQTSAFQNWKNDLNYRFVRWHELPDIDLYMDQLITFVERNIGDLFSHDEKCITPAMINNYVKLQLIPKPIKKRYAKKHLAYLMAITTLKQVLPIPKIREGIDQAIHLYGADGAYNLFCQTMDDALHDVLNQSSMTKNDSQLDTLHYAAFAFASKLVTLKLIDLGGLNNDF